MTFAPVVQVLLPIYAVIALGWLYARGRQPDMDTANHLNVVVFAPALVFHALTTSEVDRGAVGPLMLCAAAIVVLGGLLALPCCRWLKVRPLALLPAVMFNNAGTLGIPLCVLAFGEQALAPAVLVWVVQVSLHMTLGLRMLDPEASTRALLRSPLVLAAAGGLACAFLAIEVPRPLATAVGLLAGVSVPLMLFALGVRLVHVEPTLWRIGLAGGALRPLAGLLVAWPLLAWLELSPLERQVLVVFALLPPAVMNFLFAERYGPQPAETAAVVMLGTLLSLPVLALALGLLLAGG